MANYFDVVVETYLNVGEASNSKVRVRALDGQGNFSNLSVECSRGIRKMYPVGTKFVIKGKIINRESGPPFIYSHYNWDYRAVDNNEADEQIRKNFKVR